MRRRLATAALAALVASMHAAFAPRAVVAQEIDTVDRARALFESGVALSQEQRWTEALEAFRASRAHIERPSTVFNIATVLQRLGRAHDAIAAVDTFLQIADPLRDGEQIDQARGLRDALIESLTHVVVRLRPAFATLTVDARPIPGEGDLRELELDAGEHVLVVSAPGFETETIEIAASPGSRTEHDVALERIAIRPAQLVVRASRGDARVSVDEHDVGLGQAEVELSPGRHVVRVAALEHETYQRIVELAPAERLEVEAPLRRVSGGSVLDEPAFWIVVGSVVAIGAGVGVGVGVGTSGGEPRYEGSAGFTINGLTIPW